MLVTYNTNNTLFILDDVGGQANGVGDASCIIKIDENAISAAFQNSVEYNIV